MVGVFAGKGYEGDIKWIPTVMVGIAKTAVTRVRLLSENARQLAKWIEKHRINFTAMLTVLMLLMMCR